MDESPTNLVQEAADLNRDGLVILSALPPDYRPRERLLSALESLAFFVDRKNWCRVVSEMKFVREIIAELTASQ